MGRSKKIQKHQTKEMQELEQQQGETELHSHRKYLYQPHNRSLGKDAHGEMGSKSLDTTKWYADQKSRLTLRPATGQLAAKQQSEFRLNSAPHTLSEAVL